MGKDACVKRIEIYHYEPQIKPAQMNGNSLVRIAAYCRVSTLQEEQELSFRTQCEYYERLITADKSKVLAGIYGDHGVSGLSTKERPGFNQLLHDCFDGRVDVVITKSVSRFSRNMADCVATVNSLRQRGIPVVFEDEGITSTDLQAELFLSILASLAQEESGSLSRRVRWSLDKRAELGDPARRCAYGFMKETRNEEKPWIDDEGRKWVPQKSEAKRVRLAFKMASEVFCYKDIVSALNRLEAEEGTGAVWKQPRVFRMLTHEAYRGDLLTNKGFIDDYLTHKMVRNRGQHPQYYIEGHHEPLVPVEQYEQVQSHLRARLLNTNYQKLRQKYKENILQNKCDFGEI